MNRRTFLRSGAAFSGLSPMVATPLAVVGATGAARAADGPRAASRHVPSITIRDYLSREAGRSTSKALDGIGDIEDLLRLRPVKHRQFLEMMGLDAWWTEQRDPPPVTVTGVVEREKYRIEKLHFEAVPGLFVTANLYVPKPLSGRAPAVLYVCGHARNQKVHYQAHPRRLAELGFVAMLVETIQLGEVEGFHHGCYREGWWHWYSRGYTPAGIELLNGIRALDLLAHRPEVDPAKLGVTGISGGGATSWWIAAADDRVAAAAPVCGTATLYSHVHDRTIDGHCDCMWWVNTRRWDLADLGALIAPRPFLIGSADKDGIFTIESIRTVHAQLKGLYQRLGAGGSLRLVETPGGHSYHERSRTEIFAWFMENLMEREVAPDRVGDIDDRPEKQESADTLRVFVNGPPAGNRTATIHDSFPVLARPPSIRDAAGLTVERERVVAALRETTFGAFPSEPPPLDVQVEYEFDEDAAGYRFGFTSEDGWRLHALALHRKPLEIPAPAVIGLRSPNEDRDATRGFLMRLNAPWLRVAFEPRGTGDTSWGDDLDWHIRRAAAWTGRTVASMRVWDTLRAIAAVKETGDATRIALAARGELCAVALYAALLDGGIRTLFLENPPATQNAAGEKDGRGPAIEMLDCLRITDLPQVAGLLWPAELVFVGDTPATYEWAEALHRHLGGPGRVSRVRDLRDWNPA